MKIKVFLILLLSIIIVGCSPQKRLNRLYRTNSQLFITDTVMIVDTLVIPSKSIETKAALPVGVGTAIKFKNPQSTMRGDLQVDYNKSKDTVFIALNVETVAEIVPYVATHITNKQPRTVTPPQPKTNSWTKLWIGIVIGLTAFIGLTITAKLLFK